MLPATRSRVTRNSSYVVNHRIERETRERVRHLAGHTQEIQSRLAALDREWDIERALELLAAGLALSGTGLGAFVDRRFLILPALVTGFLLQHALQGWCPPVPVLRRLGFRTAAEIEYERYALKLVRGDFTGLEQSGYASSPPARIDSVLEAVGA
ncbi:MAG TPA: hypothetical protein VJ770_03610 [Stellaceae bacterium]|nr:hypothetical protein [Stellaceae bacterium]